MHERSAASNGGCGYENWYRELFVLGTATAAIIPRRQRIHHRSTEARWRRRHATEGHCCRRPHSGGGASSRVLNERDVLHLLEYIIAWPEANNSECMIYVMHKNPLLLGILRDYHLSRAFGGKGAIKNLRIVCKVMRRTSLELRRELYFTQPPPLGVFGVDMTRCIDIDECFIFITCANRLKGRCFVGKV